jgi:hypothetical protein
MGAAQSAVASRRTTSRLKQKPCQYHYDPAKQRQCCSSRKHKVFSDWIDCGKDGGGHYPEPPPLPEAVRKAALANQRAKNQKPGPPPRFHNSNMQTAANRARGQYRSLKNKEYAARAQPVTYSEFLRNVAKLERFNATNKKTTSQLRAAVAALGLPPRRHTPLRLPPGVPPHMRANMERRHEQRLNNAANKLLHS